MPLLWEADGSLRDVYLLQTSLADWEAFLALASTYQCDHSFHGEPCPVPAAEEIFGALGGSNHLLSISLGGVTANCHFFAEGEIELDIEPREVRGPEEHSRVMRFVEQLSSATGKPALIAPENGADIPFLSFNPASGTWFAPEHKTRGV